MLTDFVRSDLSTRFKQLFKHSFVRHTPMRCSCPDPVLRRQPTGPAQTDGYILPVIVTEGMLLEQAIAQAMWVEEEKSNTKACPGRGDKVQGGYFTKFAYLPEVFFISPHFMSKRYPDGYIRYTHDEKFVYPDRMDMSILADDPQRPGDQVDTIYKLQSVITCSHQNMDVFTEYKAALRLGELQWTQYAYAQTGDRGLNATYPIFETIVDPKSRQRLEEAPHILVYVRDRHTALPIGAAPDGFKRKFLPDPNTMIHDMYGLDSSHLDRFVEAQQQPGTEGHSTMYESARYELSRGRKTSHWMWFMFPQIFGMTSSRLGELYAIKSLGEAIAYWQHPDLKRRYLDLLHVVLDAKMLDSGFPEKDLEKMFGRIDALKFGASLILFGLICNDEERHVFEQVPKLFNKTFDLAAIMGSTVRQLYDWLHDADEKTAIAWMHHYVEKIPDHRAGEDDGKQGTKVPERGGLSVLVTSPKALAYDIILRGEQETEPSPANGKAKGHVPDAFCIAGKSLLTELEGLSQTEVYDSDDDGRGPEYFANRNNRATSMGKLLLGYAFPGETDETPEFLEKARRLGRNLIQLTRPPTEPSESGSEAGDDLPQVDGADDGADDEMAFDQEFEPHDEGRDFRTAADSFELDDSSDELAGDSHPDEEDPHEAIAIPTDPNDPRIEASQAWTLDDLKAEFQREQLDQRGLRNDHRKHRMKFLKHFELERDYSIYHESRLRQAVKDKDIFIAKGADKADKAELVDALTEYDTQSLGAMEYVGEDTEQTDSAEFEAEEYQSSEGRSSASEETPRPKKRHRGEYEEEEDDFIEDEDGGGDNGDEDYYDEDEIQPVPRALSKGHARVRTRY